MKKLIKYGLLAAGGTLVLAVAGAVVLALTFDPNRYKADLERLAKEQTGRTLKLRGKLELAFYPSVGAKVAGVSFSERGSEQEFLSVESAHASVKVMPLLRGEVIVDAIRVTGLKAQVVVGKDGRFNFDDLLTAGEAKPAAPAQAQPKAQPQAKAPAKPSPQAPESRVAKGGASELVTFQVAGVRVERSAIAYRDLAAGSEIALSEVRITTGRIAEKAGGKLALSALARGRNPEFDLKVDLHSDYQLDLPDKIALSRLDAKSSGSAAGMTGLALSTAGDVTFDLVKNHYRIGNLVIDFKGANGADALTGELKLAGARGSERTLVVPKFSADVSITSPDLPAPIRTLRLPLSGSLRANFEKRTASAELAGKIDESTLQAKFGLAKFTPPSYLFDINIDRLNLYRYLAAQKPAAASVTPGAGSSKSAPPASSPVQPRPVPGKPAGKPAETSIDLAPLKGLNASGKLQIGALQVLGLRLTEVKAEARAAGGRVDIAPHGARLYDGTVAGALTLEADGNRVSLKETLSDVSVGPMLKDVAQRDYVQGRGSVALDVVASGNTVEAMKRSLAGSAKVNLREGALKGFDALEILRKAQTLVGAQPARSADRNAGTDFGELFASFRISEGVARNDDLDVKAPGLRISGAGTIDIGRSRIDYGIKPTLVTNAKGQGVTVPVRLTGALEDMQHEVNYSAAARDVVKQVGRSVRDRVKGLIGR